MLTCPKFVSGWTRTAEAVDLVVACARRARSINIPLNALVDLITLLTFADGNCIESSVAVAGVIQVSIGTNTAVSTCGCVEDTHRCLGIHQRTRNHQSQGNGVQNLCDHLASRSPRSQGDTCRTPVFPHVGTTQGSTRVPFFQLWVQCGADDGSAIFNNTEQARRPAFGRESIRAIRRGIKGMTRDASVRQRPIIVHLRIKANLDVS